MNLYLDKVSDTAILPEKQTEYSACYDVFCDLVKKQITVWSGIVDCIVESGDRFTLFPGDRAMIPTGLKMSCDPGWKIELAPRSGNAIKKGLTLINSIGIIDADFTHEVMLLMVNLSSTKPVTIFHGDRLAQLSLEKVYPVNMIVGSLPDLNSDRNGGFGSTG